MLPITVAIMAGGQSRRMGRDKSFVPVGGRPMIEVIIERVRGLGEMLMVVTNKPEAYAHLGLPMVGDEYVGAGPLAGIYSALGYANRPYLLVVACDMPWLNRPLLEYMISLRETADAIVPCWQGRPEPLHAVYSQACRQPIAASLDVGQRKATAFFDRVRACFLEEEEIGRFDPQGRSFANINTPEELRSLKIGD